MSRSRLALLPLEPRAGIDSDYDRARRELLRYEHVLRRSSERVESLCKELRRKHERESSRALPQAVLRLRGPVGGVTGGRVVIVNSTGKPVLSSWGTRERGGETTKKGPLSCAAGAEHDTNAREPGQGTGPATVPPSKPAELGMPSACPTQLCALDLELGRFHAWAGEGRGQPRVELRPRSANIPARQRSRLTLILDFGPTSYAAGALVCAQLCAVYDTDVELRIAVEVELFAV